MYHSRRLPILAIIFIVLLRLSIGWQFLYEGLWKYDTLDTAQPWTSEGYLKASQGPLRDRFRNMTGDPNDLRWLDFDNVADRWDRYQSRFASHYQLDESQQSQLDELLNGPADFRAVLEQLPPGVEFEKKYEDIIKYDADAKRLIVDGKRHLTPSEYQDLKEKARLQYPADGEELTDEAKAANKIVEAYHKALDRVYQRAARLSFKEKLAASLKGDPQRAGVIQEDHEGTVDFKYMGDIDKYRLFLEQYEGELTTADAPFLYDHLTHTNSYEIVPLRQQLVGPVKALEQEYQQESIELLKPDQLQRGPVTPEMTPVRKIDLLTIGGLLILGAMLIFGFGTRIAAVLGAGMLISFYLAMPPWPGVPEAPGPEHSYIINKNVIEAVALLAIACLPTGRWFGVDSFVAAIFGKRPKAKRRKK